MFNPPQHLATRFKRDLRALARRGRPSGRCVARSPSTPPNPFTRGRPGRPAITTPARAPPADSCADSRPGGPASRWKTGLSALAGGPPDGGRSITEGIASHGTHSQEDDTASIRRRAPPRHAADRSRRTAHHRSNARAAQGFTAAPARRRLSRGGDRRAPWRARSRNDRTGRAQWTRAGPPSETAGRGHGLRNMQAHPNRLGIGSVYL